MDDQKKNELIELTRSYVEATIQFFEENDVPQVAQMSILFSVMVNITIRCGKSKSDLVRLLHEMLNRIPSDDFDMEDLIHGEGKIT